MKHTITITATTEIDIDEEELPDDCSSVEEALDAIKDSLTLDPFTVELGDFGEADFRATTVTISQTA